MAEKVRVRFAPSPTGYLHIGGVRTAIFNYLFARHHGGTFILRIEDTDRQRSTLEAVEQILDSLRWLALDWDEGPYFQSERTEIYREHLERLLSEAKAYRCYCRPEELEAKRRKVEAEKGQYNYDGTCRNRDPKEDPAGRSFTVRFRTLDVVPDHFDDLVLGRLPIDQAKLDDWILARSDGSPTYNFCVVVDDATMRISHVIRGNDHVQNTPRQILLYRAFGYPVPQLAHMSLTHGPDGSKLSKRREEEYRKLGISVSVQEYRRMGYLPDALVNYLSRLGWSYGDQEIFTRRELQEKFDLKHVGKSAGVMNPDKLKWLNAHYIKETDDAALAQMLLPFLAELGVQTEADSRLHRIAHCLKERSRTLGEMARSAMIFFRPPETYDPKAVKKWFKPGVEPLLARVHSLVQSADLNDEQAMEDAFRTLAEQLTKGKLGEVAQPVRLALTGTTVSPSLFTVMSILGHEQILKRLDRALAEQEAHPERT